jgi:tripartite-type tricarboxylate transporter receptor subunit TctC
MHLAGELLRTKAGMAWTHVPYASGGAKTLTDLAGGFTNSAILSVSVAGPMIKDGRLKGIGVFSDKRAPLLPDVPTFQESGVTGVEASSWLGLVAPAGTPRPIVERLNKAAVEIIRNPEVVARLQALALEPTPGSIEDFDAIIKAEFSRWTQVVKEANVKVEQ